MVERSPDRKRRYRLLARIAVFVVVSVPVAVIAQRKPWRATAAAPVLRTVAIAKGPLAVRVTANGTLSAHTTVQVGAQVTGRVVELDADFNDVVHKGQVVAKLDPVIYESAVDQAKANLHQALANVDKAVVAEMDGKRQYLRQIKMREQQLIADLTVEQAEVTYKQAVANTVNMRAQVAQNRAQLDQAVANLGYCTIYSPIDGIVLTRSYDLGQTVQSALSAPTLFTIAADLAKMQIDTSVAESDVGRLHDEMKATFTVDAYPDKTFNGKVRQVRNSSTTTNGVVTYDAVIDVDNTDRNLRPGMTATVAFVVQDVGEAITIPNAALRFKPTIDQLSALGVVGPLPMGGALRPGMEPPPPPDMGPPPGGMPAPGAQPSARGSANAPRVVWKLEGARARPVPITTGPSDGSVTQLLSGDLAPGDRVVTEVEGVQSHTGPRLGPF